MAFRFRTIHFIQLGAIAVSVVAHLALGAGLKRMRTPDFHAPTKVTVFREAPKKREKPKPKPEDEPKPDEPKVKKPPPPPPQNTPPKAAPKVEAAPPPDTPRVSAPQGPGGHFAIDGLTLGGDGSGTLAVPTGPVAETAPTNNTNATPSATANKVVEKVMKAGPATTAAIADDGCSEEIVKPKPQGAVHASYTDDARSANVEGKVTLKLVVDASGNVRSVTVLKGLGHGLDQNASAAAKALKFTPATRCGKPVEGTFVIAVRFALGE